MTRYARMRASTRNPRLEAARHALRPVAGRLRACCQGLGRALRHDAGELPPHALYPNWPVARGISSLTEMRNRAGREPVTEAPPGESREALAERVRRETIWLMMNYAIEVMGNLREMTPPVPPPPRVREAMLREAKVRRDIARIRGEAAALEAEASAREEALQWGRPGEDW